MKIGDEILVHGFIDEIRKDTVIVRNDGGYFGTSKTEIMPRDQEWDEVIFDMNEFFSIVDDGKITVMRRGRGRVTVERPVMRMETTICSYRERNEDE